MENRIFIGIDPGKSGAICFMFEGKMFTRKCPTTLHDMVDIFHEIDEIAPNLQKYACIEKVHSFPGQGVRSVWTFAENFAFWKAIMATLKIPYIQVGPKMWQRYYSTAIPKDKKDRKNYLKQLAQEKYPSTKVTLYNAEAILIAEYCKYKYPI